jgi:DNA-binding NarL/FixJ family response regulator
MIDLLLVNRSRLICSVMAAALEGETDIQVVGSATSVDEALSLVRSENCDVLLLRNNLPNEGALELTQALNEYDLAVKVLVIGMAEQEELILHFIEAGAAGYVLSTESVTDLVRNIRAAARGEALVSPEIAGALMSRITELTAVRPVPEYRYRLDRVADLTPREQDVLDLVGEGLSNQEIADRLVIEVGTVKNHVHSILQKLDAGDRDEAADHWHAIQDS